MAETKDRAEKAFDFFLEAYGAKYDKATACLAKDRAGLLTFYDFPAEHWKHLRTTNPHRKHLRNRAPEDHQDQGLPQPDHGAHHGLQVVPVGWPRNGGVSTRSHRLAEIVEGVKFKDGEKLIGRAA